MHWETAPLAGFKEALNRFSFFAAEGLLQVAAHSSNAFFHVSPQANRLPPTI